MERSGKALLRMGNILRCKLSSVLKSAKNFRVLRKLATLEAEFSVRDSQQ
jgi:hypothetical protein